MFYFFFNDTATTEIYTYLHTLSLHDALPIWQYRQRAVHGGGGEGLPDAGGDARRPVERARGDLARIRRRGEVCRPLPRQRRARRSEAPGLAAGVFRAEPVREIGRAHV